MLGEFSPKLICKLFPHTPCLLVADHSVIALQGQHGLVTVGTMWYWILSSLEAWVYIGFIMCSLRPYN